MVDWVRQRRIDSGGEVGFYRAASGSREALLIDAPPNTWVPWADPSLWRLADTDPSLLPTLECTVNAGRSRDRALLEWSPGRSLHAILRAGPLSEHETLLVARSAARALSVLNRGALVGSKRVPLVHGALGPRWVRVESNGSVRVAGAGLGKLKPERDPDRSFEWLPFLPPEDLDGGDPTEARDVFALGALIHYCMIGRGVYCGSSQLERIHAMRRGERKIVRLASEITEIVSTFTASRAQRPSVATAVSMLEGLERSFDQRAAQTLAARVTQRCNTRSSH